MVTLIVVLAAIGMSTYSTSVRRAKEAVLREDLFRLRDAIDQYNADKGIYPPDSGVARHRRVHAADPQRPDYRVCRHVADRDVGARSRESRTRHRASTTSRAARKAPRIDGDRTRNGNCLHKRERRFAREQRHRTERRLTESAGVDANRAFQSVIQTRRL